MTYVRAYPRLHLTLIDLADATPRRYGGIGLALDGPSVEIEVVHSDSLAIIDESSQLDRRAIDQIIVALSHLSQLRQDEPSGVQFTPRIRVAVSPPAHIGLGTKTATVLGILMGCSHVYNIAASSLDIQKASGRGGASGVGIHTFFHGGFTIDLGHAARPGTPFLPSSAGIAEDLPPLLGRFVIPKEWEFHLMIPQSLATSPVMVSGDAEQDFFLRNTPIPENEVMTTAAWAYHGVAAAFATRDFNRLRQSLARIQAIGFKKREIANHGSAVVSLLRALADTGCPVGMSSMGPLVFAVARRTTSDGDRLERACSAEGGRRIGIQLGHNTGYDFWG